MTARDRAIKALIDFNKEHKSTSFRDYRKSNYKPSYQDIVLIFGSWQEAIQAAEIKDQADNVPIKKISKHKTENFNMMIWMNIHMLSRKCTIHKGGCHLEKAFNLNLMGTNELNERGGWLEFNSIDEARVRHEKDFREMEFRLCRLCCAEEVRRAFREKFDRKEEQGK